jgi:hypothetical protein
MMDLHFTPYHGGTFQLRDQAVRLGPTAGELVVLAGSAWLTRSDALGDHIVRSGERVQLPTRAGAVLEPLSAGQPLTLQWQPRRTRTVPALAAGALRAFARRTARVAELSAALAQRVADSAPYGAAGDQTCAQPRG